MYFGIPQVISGLVFISGIINISLALFVRMHFRYPFIEDVFSLEVIHFSRTFILIIGVFMLFLASGLWARKIRSWQISTVFLLVSIVLHLLKNFDYKASLVLAVVFIILLYFRKLFTVRSGAFGFIKSIKTSVVILIILFLYSFFGFFALSGQFNNPVTIANITRDYLFSIFGVGIDTLIPITRHALWFEDSISTVGLVSIMLVFAAIFAPFIERKKPSEEDKKTVRDLILMHSENSSNYFGLMNDKNYFFNKKKTSVIAYKIANNMAVVLGDVAGNKEDRLETVKEFIKEMNNRGLAFCFYNTTKSQTLSLQKLKMKWMKVGEEAVIRINDFNLDTPDLKEVRYGYNRITKLGLKLNWYTLSQIPWSALHDVDMLYSRWLKGKRASPLTFSMGFYPFPLEDLGYLLTVYSTGNKILAAFSFFPYKSQSGYVLDLMLRDENAPNGVVEGALASAVYFFKEKNAEELSLGVAPLSNVTKDNKLGIIDKGLKFVFENINQFYDYKHLFKFKENFKPVWTHKYLVYQRLTEIPKLSLALMSAHLLKRNEKPNLIQES